MKRKFIDSVMAAGGAGGAAVAARGLAMCRPRALGVAVCVLLGTSPAAAATFIVNSTTDAVDTMPGDGACQSADGVCTLRAAIQEANASPGPHVINVAAGIYTLTIRPPFGIPDDAAAADDLDLLSDVTISGAGAAVTIIRACPVDQKSAPCPAGQGIADRVFHLLAGANVTIRDLAIENGRHESSGGGGIFLNGASLTLVNATIRHNTAPRAGGVFAIGALTITNSSVVDNVAVSADGGGLVTAVTATIVDSTVARNRAAVGGGISVPGGVLTITGSTIDGNLASPFNGGGISVGGTLIIRNSTISNNIASDGTGGGILGTGRVVLTNSTLSGNTASTCGAVTFSSPGNSLNNVTVTENTATNFGAGGICGNAFHLTVRNSIVANNRHLLATGTPDCSGSATSQGFNLIGDGTGCAGFTDGVNGDRVGTSAAPVHPRLGPLVDNGGATLTHALVSGSPALDGGNPAGCTDADNAILETDQRGAPRPVDGDGDGAARCDIGAVESAGLLAPFTISRVRPAAGGNVGSAVVFVHGSGFATGSTIRLSRAGEADITATSTAIEANGLMATAVFDLSGRTPGARDVVVTNPDGTAAALPGGFTVEQGGAPQLWADVIGPIRARPGRPTRFYIVVGNRGTVDATGVPLGITVPRADAFAPFTPNFTISPPPEHDRQVPTEWSGVPIHADTGPSSNIHSVLLLLPVVPAGFTGILEFTLKLDRPGPFEITFGVGTPYVGADLNPRVVDAFVAGAQEYARRTFGTMTFPAEAVVGQYVTDQLQAAIVAGVERFVASHGTDLPVHGVSHFMIDAARFAAVHPE